MELCMISLYWTHCMIFTYHHMGQTSFIKTCVCFWGVTSSRCIYSVNVYSFFHEYNTTNNFIFNGSPHSLRHVSAGNYCHRQVALQLYKRKNWDRDLSFTGRTETETSRLHLNYKLIILLSYQTMAQCNVYQ